MQPSGDDGSDGKYWGALSDWLPLTRLVFLGMAITRYHASSDGSSTVTPFPERKYIVISASSRKMELIGRKLESFQIFLSSTRALADLWALTQERFNECRDVNTCRAVLNLL